MRSLPLFEAPFEGPANVTALTNPPAAQQKLCQIAQNCFRSRVRWGT